LKILGGSTSGLPFIGTESLSVPTPYDSCSECTGIPNEYKLTLCSDSSEYKFTVIGDLTSGYYAFFDPTMTIVCGYITVGDVSLLSEFGGFLVDNTNYASCEACATAMGI